MKFKPDGTVAVKPLRRPTVDTLKHPGAPDFQPPSRTPHTKQSSPRRSVCPQSPPRAAARANLRGIRGARTFAGFSPLVINHISVFLSLILRVGVSICLLTAIRHLRHGKVLSDADARAAVEGHVLPGLRRPALPPFGREEGGVFELLGCRRVQVPAPLHRERAVDHDVALDHRKRRVARRRGERRVLERAADIIRHGRVQPQRLVQRVLQIRHILQILVRRRSRPTDRVDDLVAQLCELVGVVRQLVERP